MSIDNSYLSEEKISKLLFKFSIPCITGLLISALYNIVDQIFIGNSSLGYLGNAATGVSFPVICIVNAFAWCIGDGAAAYLSLCAGRQDFESSHKCVGTGITVSFIISICLSFVCIVFATPLMSIFGASSQTLEMAVTYFRIIALFFPFYLLVNVTNSMIRADGSPTYAMVATTLGAVFNIILDPLFIYVFDLGIAGAAYATVIGQTASFIVSMLYFRKSKTFVITKESFIPNMAILKNTISLGAATFVNQISIVIVALLCNITLFHYGELSIYGPDIPISVFSIQSKVYTVVINIIVGIVLGGQPIFGYNYGAKRMDRVKETYKLVLRYCLLVGIVATLIFQFFPESIIRIFGTGNALYMDFAVKTFRIYMSLILITCMVKVTSIFFQAIGKSINAVITSLVRDILCFVPFAIFIPMIFERNQVGTGIYGLLYSAPLADIIAIIVIIVLTVSFFKKLNKEMDEPIKKESINIIKKTHPGLIVTIAREHGTGGKQIGNMLAQSLGIPFYYKEMTALAAQESGLDQEFVSNINQNAPEILYDLYLSTNVISQAVIAQEKIIRKIADNGSCVIVGRAADYVLKDYDNVLRVFIYAPKDYRINKVSKMYNDSLDEAANHVRKSDKARASYYNNITGQKWSDPHNYDLCVDASIGEEACCKLIYDYINNI